MKKFICITIISLSFNVSAYQLGQSPAEHEQMILEQQVYAAQMQAQATQNEINRQDIERIKN